MRAVGHDVALRARSRDDAQHRNGFAVGHHNPVRVALDQGLEHHAPAAPAPVFVSLPQFVIVADDRSRRVATLAHERPQHHRITDARGATLRTAQRRAVARLGVAPRHRQTQPVQQGEDLLAIAQQRCEGVRAIDAESPVDDVLVAAMPELQQTVGADAERAQPGLERKAVHLQARDVGTPRCVDDRLRVARQRQRHGQAREGDHVLRERRRVLRRGDIPIERVPAVAEQQQRQFRCPLADLERLELEQRNRALARILEPPARVRDPMARKALQQQRRARVAVGEQHAGVAAGRRRGKRRRVGDNASRRQLAAQPAQQMLRVRRQRFELGRLQFELPERHRVCRVAVVPGVEAGIDGFHAIPTSLCSCRLSRHCGCRRQ